MKHALLGVGCLLLMGLSWRVGAYDEIHLKKLRAVGSCLSCDLCGAFLYDENLAETNLTNANLTTVTLVKLKNLNTAITTGASFSLYLINI